MLEALFRYYQEDPKRLPDIHRKRGRKLGWPRIICDYLAGMTDRYAMSEYSRLMRVAE